MYIVHIQCTCDLPLNPFSGYTIWLVLDLNLKYMETTLKKQLGIIVCR